MFLVKYVQFLRISRSVSADNCPVGWCRFFFESITDVVFNSCTPLSERLLFFSSLLTGSCPCHVLEPQVLVLRPENPWKLSRTSHYANSPLCMIMWSVNSVTSTVHEITARNGLLTDVGYYCCMSSSRKVLVLADPRGPIYKSLSLSSKSLTTLWVSIHVCLSVCRLRMPR